MPSRSGFFLLCSALLAAAASAQAPTPPCYNPLNSDLETLCYTTVTSSGNITVRSIGAGVDGVLVTGMSAPTNFSVGSVASAVPVFEYFLSDNDHFQKIPLTVPLIFRPDAAGTWLTSFALPTSVFSSAAAAPGFIPGTDARFEEFSASPKTGRLIAALTFWTIQEAQEGDYSAACAKLSAALPGLSLQPVQSAWSEAWVTYSTREMVGLMVNECWMEVEKQ